MAQNSTAEIGLMLFNAASMAYARGLDEVAAQIEDLAMKLHTHPSMPAHLRLVSPI